MLVFVCYCLQKETVQLQENRLILIELQTKQKDMQSIIGTNSFDSTISFSTTQFVKRLFEHNILLPFALKGNS